MSSSLVQTNTLRVGSLILVSDKLCKIVSFTTAKPGKHGASKMIIKAKDLVTGKNLETSAASKGTISVPDVQTNTYDAIELDGEYLVLMDNEGKLKNDVRCPDENVEMIKNSVKNGYDVEITLLTFGKIDILTSVKTHVAR